jgi:mercuric ion binding protein
MSVTKIISRTTVEAGLFTLLFCLAGLAYAEDPLVLQPGEELVTLSVENMTWAGCLVAVRNSLKVLDGVRHVEVDLDEKQAVVVFARTAVETIALIEATTNIGFPSSIKIPASIWPDFISEFLLIKKSKESFCNQPVKSHRERTSISPQAF